MTSESNERRRPIDWTRNDDDCYYYESHVANAVGRYLSTVNHHQPKEKMTEEGAKPRKKVVHYTTPHSFAQIKFRWLLHKLNYRNNNMNGSTRLSLSLSAMEEAPCYIHVDIIHLYVRVIW